MVGDIYRYTCIPFPFSYWLNLCWNRLVIHLFPSCLQLNFRTTVTTTWPRQFSKRFYDFLKNEKWLTLNQKVSETKVEIRRWQFSCIFRYRCCGILRFFGRRRFQGEICWSKSPNLQIFKKEEKLAFLYGKIRPSIMIFLLFFLSIFLAHPRATLCTPELWSGTHNEDFQRWSPIDHKWSFSIISSKNHFFSPIKIWSKWSLKIVPKPSVLRKKLIKATLKYIDWRAFCTYWL